MYATTEARRRANEKYRVKNMEKYAEYKRNYYHSHKDYVERERRRLKERYDAKKEFKAFLNILLE
jgi:hypothetical protein